MLTSSRRKPGALISWPVAAELLHFAFEQQLLQADEDFIELLGPAQPLQQLPGDDAIGQGLAPMKHAARFIPHQGLVPEQRDRHQQIAGRGQIITLLCRLPLGEIRAQHRQAAGTMGAEMPHASAMLIGTLRVNHHVGNENINALFFDSNNQLQGLCAPHCGHHTQVNGSQRGVTTGTFSCCTAVQQS